MNKRALIVDDSEVNRLTIKTYLKQIGFYIDESEDGFKALKTLKNDSNYSVIFTDLEMPNMNGFEFIKRVKSNEQLKNTPIVIISSSINYEIINKFDRLEGIYHIDKPFSIEKIKKILNKADIEVN